MPFASEHMHTIKASVNFDIVKVISHFISFPFLCKFLHELFFFIRIEHDLLSFLSTAKSIPFLGIDHVQIIPSSVTQGYSIRYTSFATAESAPVGSDDEIIKTSHFECAEIDK